MTSPTITPGSAQHRRLITASKIGAIFGVDEFTTPAQLWGMMHDLVPPKETTPAMMRGHIQEASILDWFYTVEHPELKKVAGETTWTNPNHDWCCANTDSHATTPTGQTVFVEVKSIARPNRTWGEPGTEEVPEKYWLQVQFQMWMTNYLGGEEVELTYLVKHGPYVDQYDIYPIRYDPHAAGEIATRAYDFYRLDECPPPTQHREEHKFFGRMNPEIDRELNWEINQELATQYITAAEAVKNAQAEESRTKAEILKAMGKARTATCNGVTIAYRRTTKTGISLYPPQRKPTIDDINQQAA